MCRSHLPDYVPTFPINTPPLLPPKHQISLRYVTLLHGCRAVLEQCAEKAENLEKVI